MKRQPFRTATLLLALSLAPALAAHELDRHCAEVRLGLAIFDGEPFRYGVLAGHEGGRAAALLDVLLCRGRRPGVEGDHYAYLHGERLRLDSRQLRAGLGVQGRYRVSVDLRALPGPASSGQVVFHNPGSTDLRLPTDWQAGATTAALPGLGSAMTPVPFAVDRRIGILGLRLHLGERWRSDSRYREQRRSGLRSFAGLIGNSGGNPRVAMLPEPVDQRTRDVELGLRYGDERSQLRLWLLLSQFDSGHSALRWDNPYSAIAGWDPSAGHPDGRGQASLMPDNRYGQLGVSMTRTLSASTRFSADLAFGRLRQDQSFLPYTINPSLADSVHTPLPRASLDGRVDTRLLHLRLIGRPDANWHWQLRLRHDERDNRTPRDGYLGIGGDSQLQDPDPTSGRLRFNLPVGHRERQFAAEAGWRNGRGFDARVGAERRHTDRTWSARAASNESRLHAVLRARPHGPVQTGLRLLYSDRGGGTYLGSRPFIDSHSPAHVDSVPGQFENLPGLRQYHLADRRRQHGSAFVQVEYDPWHLGLSHGRLRDRYHASEFGLRRTQGADTQLDLGFTPGGAWSLHAWLARERLRFDQAGRAFNGGAVRLEHANDPARNWFADHRDRVDAVGVGLQHDLAERRWRLRADLAHSVAHGSVSVRTGPALSSAPLPDSRTRLSTVDLSSEWRIDAATSLQLRWRLERTHSRDFALDGVGPGQLTNVILTGESAPNDRAQAVLLSWHRRW